MPAPLRFLFVLLAGVFLALGIIGIIVPGMPTTVFVLLAAACAARGSPRFHGWLISHRLFGPMIVDWQNGGRVSRKAKRSAALAMAVCAVIVLLVAPSPWRWGAIASMAMVLAWLWRRPEN